MRSFNFAFVALLTINVVIISNLVSCESSTIGTAGTGDSDTDTDSDTDSDNDSDSDTDSDSDSDTDTGNITDDPETCEEAAVNHTYVGCNFWPTINFNPVSKQFDFAVVIANGQEEDAEIAITRGGNLVAEATVDAGGLEEVHLPWIDELKGPTFANADTSGARVTNSVRLDDGAYNLVSSIPVTVWQFSPLQYKLDDFEVGCIYMLAGQTSCLSVANDAALLLPSTAMTGAYRVFGRSATNGGDMWGSTPMAFTITAVEDNTDVDVHLSGDIASGTGVAAATAGQMVSYNLNAGDVVQFLGAWGAYWGIEHSDLSGTVVLSKTPVQVIASNPISSIPDDATGYADHIEETILPAESLGDEYLVAPPTGPDGNVIGHIVRFFGNFDNTTLTYPSGNQPPGAPTSLNAGDVVEIAQTTLSFQVEGSEAFALASFQVGGQLQDPGADPTRGDPAFSMLVTNEQFRTKYTFLAPVDYMENYADVLVPDGATVTIDGVPLTGPATAIGSSGWSVVRQLLGDGNNGAHQLESDAPVGLQVMGYGHATAYYYPGGLNLNIIAEPPPPPV